MIHVVGVVLVAVGVGIAHFPWSEIRQKTQIKKLRESRQPQDKSSSGSAEQTDLALPEEETSSSQMVESRQIPQRRKPYQFTMMTAMLGLSTIAQFSIPTLTPITLVVIGYLSSHIYKEAATAIFKEKRIQVDLLDATVITLTVAFGQIAAAGFMIWVLDIASLLLEKTRNRSQRYITDIFGTQSRFAWLLIDGQELEVDIKTLKKGDIIIVNTGEQVPVDGTVVHGTAMIDQHSLTGESAPVEKHKDDKVFATTVLLMGKIHVSVQETGENTLASKIIQIINEASEFKIDLQSMGERIADRMVVPTLGLGTLGYFTAGPMGMVAIINADYGTGIRIAAPIALLASLGKAAQHGVLIKDSKVFEMLHNIDVVLFDKTGTLTYDVPTVTKIVSTGLEYPEEKILLYTAAAEQKFSHPIAKAVLQKAKDMRLTIPSHDDSKYHVGFGIEVVVNQEPVKVGSARYMEQENIALPNNIKEALELAHHHGHSAILIAINDNLAGLIELQASVREETVEIMSHLRHQGIKEIVMISGDHEAPTRKLANQLHMDRYFAGVLPHEKADYVKSLQAEGKKVMMVGDGINDSAALSLADVAISLQGASTIAIDVADVVFLDGNLKKFDYLFRATDVLHKNVRRSFALIAIPNTFCIIGGLTGYFGLASSLVLNNGFNFISAVNGMWAYKEAEGAEDKPITIEDEHSHGEMLEMPEMTELQIPMPDQVTALKLA